MAQVVVVVVVVVVLVAVDASRNCALILRTQSKVFPIHTRSHIFYCNNFVVREEMLFFGLFLSFFLCLVSSRFQLFRCVDCCCLFSEIR